MGDIEITGTDPVDLPVENPSVDPELPADPIDIDCSSESESSTSDNGEEIETDAATIEPNPPRTSLSQMETELRELLLPPPPEQAGQELKKSKSLENLEAFSIIELPEYRQEAKEKPKGNLKTPGLTVEDTWDYSLKTLHKDMTATTIWITDKEVSKKLGYLNAFGDCEHEVLKINCHCPCAVKFSICNKCHLVFCSNKCIKFVKDGKPITEASVANAESEKVNDTVPPEPTESKTTKEAPKLVANSNSILQRPNSSQAFMDKYSNPNKKRDTLPQNSRADLNGHRQEQPKRDWNPKMPIPYASPGRNDNQSFRQQTPSGPSPPIRNALLPSPGPGLVGQCPIPPVPFYSRPQGFQNQRFGTPPMGNGIMRNGAPYRPYPPRSQFPLPGNSFVPMQVIRNMAPAPPMRHNFPNPTEVNRGFPVPELAVPESPPVPKEEIVRISRDPQGQLQQYNLQYANNMPGMPMQTTPSLSSELSSSTNSSSGISLPVSSHREMIPKNIVPNIFRKPASTIPTKENVLKINPTEIVINSEPFLCFGVPMMVKYSSGDSLFDFYVSNVFADEVYEQVKESIENMKFFRPHKNVRKDSYCLAQFPNGEDVKWYRGRIVDFNEEFVQVYFIDFGGIESLKPTQITEMPQELMKFRSCTFRIAIGDFKKSNSTSEESLNNVMLKFLIETSFQVTLLDDAEPGRSLEKPMYKARVEINHEGQWLNLTTVLVNDDFGMSIEIKNEKSLAMSPIFASLNKEIPIIIGYVKDFSDFNVIPLTFVSDREKLMTQLNKKPIILEDYSLSHWRKSDYMCLAQFSDGQWARCKITSIPEANTAEIRFVDFGDTATVNFQKLKRIPKHFIETPKFAYRCCLPVFPIDNWSVEDIQFLKDIQTTDEVCIVAYEWVMKSRIERHVVEIFIGSVVKGLSKALLTKKDVYRQVYEVDLDIRKKLKLQEKMSSNTSVQSSFKSDQPNSFVASPTSLNRNAPEVPLVDNRVERRPPKPSSMTSTDSYRSSVSSYHTNSQTSSSVKTSSASESKRGDFRPPKPASISSNLSHSNAEVQGQNVLGVNRINITPSPAPPPNRAFSDYPFTVDQIVPSPSLQSLDKKTAFQITHIFSFNRIYIVPCALGCNEFMQLQDEITDYCGPDCKLDKFPAEGSVILVPYEDYYYRATIKRRINEQTAEVQLIDTGFTTEVCISQVKPANQNLLQYPCRGYEVKLVDVEDSPKLLLLSEFMELMEISRKRRYVVDFCDSQTNPCTVSLSVLNALRETNLSKLILSKQIWKWERLYEKGCSVDTDLIKNGDWTQPTKMDSFDVMCNLPLRVELEAEISRISVEGDLWLVNIKAPAIQRDFDVLQNQIKRYIEKVKADDFYPVFNEAVLLYLKDGPEMRSMNLRGMGRWNRCYRQATEYEDVYRNVDVDESYPMSFDEHFTVRRLCPEFCRVPLGIAECIIQDFEPTKSVIEILERDFKAGTLIRFIAERFDPDNAVYLIRCPELDNRIKQSIPGSQGH